MAVQRYATPSSPRWLLLRSSSVTAASGNTGAQGGAMVAAGIKSVGAKRKSPATEAGQSQQPERSRRATAAGGKCASTCSSCTKPWSPINESRSTTLVSDLAAACACGGVKTSRNKWMKRVQPSGLMVETSRTPSITSARLIAAS